MSGTSGPWTLTGKGGSTMTLTYPGNNDHTYEIEYRRGEPGAVAGYYLFGPSIDGVLLHANTSEGARFEAIVVITERCPLPDVRLSLAWTCAHRSRVSAGG